MDFLTLYGAVYSICISSDLYNGVLGKFVTLNYVNMRFDDVPICTEALHEIKSAAHSLLNIVCEREKFVGFNFLKLICNFKGIDKTSKYLPQVVNNYIFKGGYLPFRQNPPSWTNLFYL